MHKYRRNIWGVCGGRGGDTVSPADKVLLCLLSKFWVEETMRWTDKQSSSDRELSGSVLTAR